MNCINNGKYTGKSCLGCTVGVENCEIRDRVYRRRWIPVSERLPKEDGYYLVSCNGGNIHTDFFWCDNGNGNSHNNTWLNPYAYEIIAWQPLPERYKEE